MGTDFLIVYLRESSSLHSATFMGSSSSPLCPEDSPTPPCTRAKPSSSSSQPGLRFEFSAWVLFANLAVFILIFHFYAFLEWSKFRGNKTTTRTSLALPPKYAYDSWNCNEERQWSIAKIRKLCDSTSNWMKWTISNNRFETIKTIFYKLPAAGVKPKKNYNAKTNNKCKW